MLSIMVLHCCKSMNGSTPGRGTESMLGSRGSKSDTSSGNQEGRSIGPGLEPQ